MNKNRFFSKLIGGLCGLCLLTLAGCAADEMPGADGRLPEGAYPLVFTAVQASETPLTRVSETAENGRITSQWEGGEVICVRIGDGAVGRYRLNRDGTAEAIVPCYWQSTATATVTAWYSNIEGQSTVNINTVNLSDQSAGLAYVLQATAQARYDEELTLSFVHQLAKVRVKIMGLNENQVQRVGIQGHTSCVVTDGKVTGLSPTGDIETKKNGGYYEANLVPMRSIHPDGFIRLNQGIPVQVEGLNRLEFGQVYTITLRVN